MWSAKLPYPPTVNHYWGYGNNRVFISPEGRAYRRQVQAILAGVPRGESDIRVSIVVFPPDKRQRDLDNILKCLLDSMTAAQAWNDDSQVAELAVVRGGLGGFVVVEVSEIESEVDNGT